MYKHYNNMGRKNGNQCGKLEKYEKNRKRKKDNKKRDFELNGKYSKKAIRKLEAMSESRAKKPNENKNNEKQSKKKSKPNK